MRIVFMGSPDFAVPALEALLGRHEVVLVVTQPDKPAGRGGKLTAPAVKAVAEAAGVPVFQPRSARPPEVAAQLAATGAELGVVVAYGKILPKAVLEAFPRGCLNIHGSLLPRYRGAAPIQRAVMSGDAETGVAIMQLDEGMDTGPVYREARTPIGPDDTAGDLFARLAPMGAALLLEVIEAIAAGTAVAVPQDHALATHAAMLDKADGAVDFARPAALVSAHIRGVDPWPGGFAAHRGQPLKLFRARAALGAAAGKGAAPGTVVDIEDAGMLVATADGAVWIGEVQPPGKKRMRPRDLASGRGIAVGDMLTTPPREAAGV
jgi:methionyl-tRNA formyltransferase